MAPVTLPARYRGVLLALIALVQCYATWTQDGFAPLSYQATMAECQVQSKDYRRFDTGRSTPLDCRWWSATAVLRPTDEAATAAIGARGGDGGSAERVMSRPSVTLLRDHGRP